jgi:HPt (histidine-containing phosphotransfer) domain-containing protein
MSDAERDEPAAQVLDRAAFEDAAGGDRELMQELAELYVSDTEARLPELLEAAEAGQLEQMGRLAHGMKGSSASIGAAEAAEAFRRVEVMGRTGATEGLEEALDVARETYTRTKAVLQRLAA